MDLKKQDQLEHDRHLFYSGFGLGFAIAAVVINFMWLWLHDGVF